MLCAEFERNRWDHRRLNANFVELQNDQAIVSARSRLWPERFRFLYTIIILRRTLYIYWWHGGFQKSC